MALDDPQRSEAMRLLAEVSALREEAAELVRILCGTWGSRASVLIRGPGAGVDAPSPEQVAAAMAYAREATARFRATLDRSRATIGRLLDNPRTWTPAQCSEPEPGDPP